MKKFLLIIIIISPVCLIPFVLISYANAACVDCAGGACQTTALTINAQLAYDCSNPACSNCIQCGCVDNQPGTNGNVMSIQVNNPIASEDLLALIETIVNYLLWIAVVMAPLACIVGALMFLTAGGNDKKVSTAKKMITWAIVGLTIALVSKGIVTLIQNFLESTR